MRLYLYLCFWLISTAAFAQDEIISKENVKIPCKIKSVSGQLVFYTSKLNDQLDSIATETVRELHYSDSLRVVVLPASQRGQRTTTSQVGFQDAIINNDYAFLLSAKTARYDLTFSPVPSNRTVLVVTPDSRAKLAPWVSLFKSHPNLSFSITVHTDTVGKTVPNQLVTERRAAALRTFFLASGISPTNLTSVGRGESEPIDSEQALNQRIEFQCTAVKGVSVLYAEAYIPPKRSEPVKSSTPVTSTQEYTRIQSVKPKSDKVFSILAYFEGLYTLKPLSGDWVDPDTGPGILQGFGGGALFTYYIKPRIGLTAQIGYSSWAVRRRYINDDGSVAFTNDQLLGRLSAQVGVRLYATKSVYIQPMAGGQLLTLTSRNSSLHPDGINEQKTSKFLPTVGGAIGYEVTQNKLLVDIAAEYYLIPNKSFTTVIQPLHFVGLRLGIGYRSQPK
ncbi:OmpA family protein [Spirosoma sp. HMF3257]|uniref:OmpA-like domain-containing protein n=1 Tax=Spirosoma telluris TaxID=2183553 RepID=A0A327NR12_9BACT|nr:OmpA family protein [Spirosoma telluris]RAI77093.1 hypothetical protein HMF3257_28165 [Spirosoma telluris]